MTIPEYNLELYRGDTFTQTFRFKDDQDVYEDFTGYTARAHVRMSPTDKKPLFVFTVTIPTQVGNDTGVIVLESTGDNHKDVMKGIEGPVGRYDLEITDTAGHTETIIRGRVTLRGDWTW